MSGPCSSLSLDAVTTFENDDDHDLDDDDDVIDWVQVSTFENDDDRDLEDDDDVNDRFQVPTFEKDPTHFQAPQQTNSDKQNFDSNQFYTLPSSTRLPSPQLPPSTWTHIIKPRPPVVTCGMGSLKKVKFVDENVVNTDNFERHSLPRSRFVIFAKRYLSC